MRSVIARESEGSLAGGIVSHDTEFRTHQRPPTSVQLFGSAHAAVQIAVLLRARAAYHLLRILSLLLQLSRMDLSLVYRSPLHLCLLQRSRGRVGCCGWIGCNLLGRIILLRWCSFFLRAAVGGNDLSDCRDSRFFRMTTSITRERSCAATSPSTTSNSGSGTADSFCLLGDCQFVFGERQQGSTNTCALS